MRVGVCSYWHNRGQAVVGRHLRSALDTLGHETFVLARPSKATAARPGLVARDGIWNQPRVTEASHYLISAKEMERWAVENALDAVFFDQNYQFDVIAGLRDRGVRTLGRFVWETFSAEHVDGAKRALDDVYSLLACERERYAGMGVESPRVRWGCHPELIEVGDKARANRDEHQDTVTFYFPGGHLDIRKPLKRTLHAFRDARGEQLRLLMKGQVGGREGFLRKNAGDDRRIELLFEDMPADRHQRLFAGCDVCLSVSRWEGLGLHLYEAVGFGMPQIANDNPPMNEVIVDGENGLLVDGIERSDPADSGIPAYDPDVRQLTAAIERLADPEVRSGLAAGAVRSQSRLSWQHTVDDLRSLLDS